MTPSLSTRRFSIPAPAAHTSLLPSLPPPLPDKPGRRQHSKMGKFRVSTRKAVQGERGTVQALQCVGIKSHLHPHPALPRSTTGFSMTRRGAKESRGKHPRENKEGRGWNHWERPAGAASLTALPQLPATQESHSCSGLPARSDLWRTRIRPPAARNSPLFPPTAFQHPHFREI